MKRTRKSGTTRKIYPSNATPTAIVRVAAPPECPWELTNEQQILLKNYLKIADASDLELKACLEVARRYRLDPFKQGQIWFIKRFDRNAVATNNTKGAYVYTPQTGIYGLLHIAGRDYKDFGSMSEAEYGPMFTHEVEGHKFKAPEWCRVKAFKKGIAEPTVATIYFDEFCPDKWDNARLFWARMPRAQIEKCAKARALRTAYPDLGGLYIPEELERMKDEYTESGRQIVSGVPTGGSHEAAQAVAQAKIAAAREGKPIEAEIVAPAPPVTQSDPLPTITVDWSTNEASPIVTGDANHFEPLFTTHCKWGADGFYHCEPRSVESIRQAAAVMRFKLVEIMPKSSSHGGKREPAQSQANQTVAKAEAGSTSGVRTAPKTKTTAAPAASPAQEPQLVAGTIERVFVTIKGNKSMALVTLKGTDGRKHEAGCWDKDIYALLSAGLNKSAEVYFQAKGQYTNLVGLKRIGQQEFTEGKVKVLQQSTREAGSKTLF